MCVCVCVHIYIKIYLRDHNQLSTIIITATSAVWFSDSLSFSFLHSLEVSLVLLKELFKNEIETHPILNEQLFTFDRYSMLMGGLNLNSLTIKIPSPLGKLFQTKQCFLFLSLLFFSFFIKFLSSCFTYIHTLQY